jgi:hypothetical protein
MAVFTRKANARTLPFDLALFRNRYRALGPLSTEEKLVSAVIVLMATLWFTRSGLGPSLPGWKVLFSTHVGDGTVSVFAALLLFVLPAGSAHLPAALARRLHLRRRSARYSLLDDENSDDEEPELEDGEEERERSEQEEGEQEDEEVRAHAGEERFGSEPDLQTVALGTSRDVRLTSRQASSSDAGTTPRSDQQRVRAERSGFHPPRWHRRVWWKTRLLEWEDVRQVNWGVILLLGSGYALADGFGASGLSTMIGYQLAKLQVLPLVLMIFLIALTVSFCTEVVGW